VLRNVLRLFVREPGQWKELVAMKRSYKPEQIVRLLQDVEAQLAAGASLREVAKQLGINPGTLSRWQRRYGGVQVDEARRMFVLEKENLRLKRIVAELELDKSILKEALSGKY
jgi:transposase-like protein